MDRTTAREMAMKLAFSRLFGGEDDYRSMLELSDDEREPKPDEIEFVYTLLDGIKAHSGELDETITRLSIGWKIERMPNVDRCILRIAIFEMLFMDDIPIGASIDEAVKLAKVFGGERSASFINGMLGTLAREIGAGEPTT